jgi:hypothetical protein
VITDWQPGVLDPGRLGAVRRSGLIDMEPDDAFDRLLELAAELTGAPRACVTLVDSTHTRALSAVGFPQELVLAAPIELSFCRFVVASGAPLVVDDSRRDPRTAGDPTIDAFDAGAWAGFPIEDADGRVLGTMCLMDPDPPGPPRPVHPGQGGVHRDRPATGAGRGGGHAVGDRSAAGRLDPLARPVPTGPIRRRATPSG